MTDTSAQWRTQNASGNDKQNAVLVKLWKLTSTQTRLVYKLEKENRGKLLSVLLFFVALSHSPLSA